MTFKDFNFDSKLLDGLDAMGFDKPTPIQEQTIPIILSNKDIIACAQTGTGKTAASFSARRSVLMLQLARLTSS